MHTPFDSTLTIHCLCAAWCGVCREYRLLFDETARAFPEARFLWVDVEDHGDTVEPVEIENFPTLLISRAGQPLFFGAVTPHASTLRRLVQACDQADALDQPEARSLTQRLLRMPRG